MLTPRAPLGPHRGAHLLEEQVPYCSAAERGPKGARWGEPQAQRHRLLIRHPPVGWRGGQHALPGTVTDTRASGGSRVEPGGVWGSGKASSHRRVRTSCRDLPWEEEGLGGVSWKGAMPCGCQHWSHMDGRGWCLEVWSQCLPLWSRPLPQALP